MHVCTEHTKKLNNELILLLKPVFLIIKKNSLDLFHLFCIAVFIYIPTDFHFRLKYEQTPKKSNLPQGNLRRSIYFKKIREETNNGTKKTARPNPHFINPVQQQL